MIPVGIAAVLVVAGLVYGFILTDRYEIPSESMLPTYDVGDIVTVNKLNTSPEVGDVTVFHPPAGADRGNQCGVQRGPGEACPQPVPALSEITFIKRVVAVGGDRLRIEQGEAIVNGEPEAGDWETLPCRSGGTCNLPTEITIPPNHFFVLGDNRGASDDSRFWGPVPQDAIIGVD